MEDNKRRQIKNCFRQAMNADLSNSMRAHGLIYKMNFGVPSPRIKLIAQQFEPNAADALYLWNEDVRESKMLATYLFPKEEMTRKLADEWAHQIQYPEIADQVCMNLFSALPFAEEIAIKWITDTNPMVVYTGFRLFVRLFLSGHYPQEKNQTLLLENLKAVLLHETAYLQQVALALAEKIADSTDNWRHLLAQALETWKNSSDAKQAELYHFICYWDEM